MSDFVEPSWLPTEERLLELHGVFLARHGGRPGIRDSDCPQRCLDSAISGALYSDGGSSEPDPLTVASHLAYYLSRNHCFVDGNKRVAWAAAVDVLRAVGLDIDASDDHVEAFMVSVASGKMQSYEVCYWLADRIHALD